MLNNYEMDKFGIINQIAHDDSVVVEKDYGKYYNDLGETANYLSYLRLGYVLAHTEECHTLLDIGYGNGAFLNAANKAFTLTAGLDLTREYLPASSFAEDDIYAPYDIITFFDSLEHFEEIDLVKDLNCKYIVISVPNCRFGTDDVWFETWKHRKPNEHLHHFNTESLTSFLVYNGYQVINTSSFEDTIRKGDFNNILSVIAKKL